MIRPLAAMLLVLSGCASIQTATRADKRAAPNDAFLVELSEVMPGEPYGFVSVSTLRPGRVGEVPKSLSEGQIATLTEAAAAEGAEVLVTERIHSARQKVYYAFGMKRMTPPSKGLASVKTCAHPELSASLQRAIQSTKRCLKGLKKTRKTLQGRVEIIVLVDGFGDTYQAAVAPDSTRDGMMGACGLDAAHEEHFGAHGEVLCRTHFEATL